MNSIHKTINVFIRSIVLPLALMLPVHVGASDLAKEKRWADQVVDAILDGDAEWLNDGKSDFLSIYTESENDKQRGVIIMHGTGIHPDWQQVVQPLRVELTTHDWHTLSIQMPILHNEADYPEYAPLYDEVAPRVDAAIDFLRKRGIKTIVLIGHSQGSAMGAYYLRTNSNKVQGFVAIGMPGGFGDERQDTIKSIGMIKTPVLDLFGSEDLESVLDSQQQRADAGKNINYRQVIVKDANHFFDGKDDELVEAVSDWLKTIK